MVVVQRLQCTNNRNSSGKRFFRFPMDTERYVQKFVTTFRMVFVHQMLKSALRSLIYCDCNGDPLGPRYPLAGLPAVYALTPQLGRDTNGEDDVLSTDP